MLGFLSVLSAPHLTPRAPSIFAPSHACFTFYLCCLLILVLPAPKMFFPVIFHILKSYPLFKGLFNAISSIKVFSILPDGNNFFFFLFSKSLIWDALVYSFVPYIYLCIWIIFFILECNLLRIRTLLIQSKESIISWKNVII